MCCFLKLLLLLSVGGFKTWVEREESSGLRLLRKTASLYFNVEFSNTPVCKLEKQRPVATLQLDVAVVVLKDSTLIGPNALVTSFDLMILSHYLFRCQQETVTVAINTLCKKSLLKNCKHEHFFLVFPSISLVFKHKCSEIIFLLIIK